MPKLFGTIALCLSLAGCAVMPDYIGPEVEHMSHATQHMGADRTNYGSEILGFTAEWSHGAGAYLELSEGLAVGRCQNGGCGEIDGPREQFEARAGWRFKVQKEAFVQIG